MSQYSGRQGRGAMRQRALDKRKEAEIRNTAYQKSLKEAEDANTPTGDGPSQDQSA